MPPGLYACKTASVPTFEQLTGAARRTAQLLRDLLLLCDVLPLEEHPEHHNVARLLDAPRERVAVSVELLGRDQVGEFGESGAEGRESWV